MQYLKLVQEAQLHRESYIAVLNGLLQTPTAKREFARSVSITPQYLSYLLNPYDRIPSPELAQMIVSVLPLNRAERDTLLDHLLLASERRLQAHTALLQAFQQVDLASPMELLLSAQAAANFVADPQQAQVQQQIVCTMGNLLLQQLQPTVRPLDYAQLCLWLHGTESARNLHASAIYHAKKARAILAAFDRTDFDAAERGRFDELAFTALRLEAVAHNNLHGARTAYELCCAGESMREVQYQPQAWLPHLYRDKINAYSALPRFSIRNVEKWTHHGKALCETLTHDQAPLLSFMLERSLAQAYLRYGNVTKAMRLLRDLVEAVEQLPVIGVLHRVVFLKTYAEALEMEGDRQTWSAIVTAALQLAQDAGLAHQVAEIKQHQTNVLTIYP